LSCELRRSCRTNGPCRHRSCHASRERHRGQDQAHPGRTTSRGCGDCLDAPQDHRLRWHGDSQDQGKTPRSPTNASPALTGVVAAVSAWRSGRGGLSAEAGADEWPFWSTRPIKLSRWKRHLAWTSILHAADSNIEGSTTVRYPEAKIKEAILHPDLEIRARATRYFPIAYSPDPANMPLVIKSVKQYGKQDAYRLIGLSRDLGQTEDTVAWVIDELNDESCNKHENYAYNLSMVLVKADPALLLPRESDILQA